MTKGSAWKLIVQFAVPVFLSQVFQQLYNTADALLVGMSAKLDNVKKVWAPDEK